MTHHSHGNKVGLLVFMMSQGGCAHSNWGAQTPTLTCLPHYQAWKGVLGRGQLRPNLRK